MPVAARKLPLADFPATVGLGDGDSPMPTAPLSAHREVEVLARISRSGSANRSEDDLQSTPVKNDCMTEFIPPGTRFHALPSPFPFKRGGALHGARVAYETWGTLAADASNAILIVTGLSPDAHAAANDANPAPGWWEAMVGPGKPIDTDRWFVVWPAWSATRWAA
ncbi:hypothetical protein G6F57_017021 [Rhizopus arrhizus]|nr:hypothetical protein G6F57_017021 [Rhizopus arrhizus]